MTHWHADLNGPDLAAGALLTVSSHHQVVRVLTADTLMIEARDGQKLSALVVERRGSDIDLVLADGQRGRLRLDLDEALHEPREGTVFSRQIWVNH